MIFWQQDAIHMAKKVSLVDFITCQPLLGYLMSIFLWGALSVNQINYSLVMVCQTSLAKKSIKVSWLFLLDAICKSHREQCASFLLVINESQKILDRWKTNRKKKEIINEGMKMSLTNSNGFHVQQICNFLVIFLSFYFSLI